MDRLEILPGGVLLQSLHHFRRVATVINQKNHLRVPYRDLFKRDDRPATKILALLPDRDAASHFDQGGLQVAGRGNLEGDFATLAAVLQHHGGGIGVFGHVLDGVGYALGVGLVQADQCLRAFRIAKNRADSAQVSVEALGRFHVQVHHRDADGFHPLPDGIAHVGFHNHQVGVERRHLFSVRVPGQRGFRAGGVKNIGDEVVFGLDALLVGLHALGRFREEEQGVVQQGGGLAHYHDVHRQAGQLHSAAQGVGQAHHPVGFLGRVELRGDLSGCRGGCRAFRAGGLQRVGVLRFDGRGGQRGWGGGRGAARQQAGQQRQGNANGHPFIRLHQFSPLGKDWVPGHRARQAPR